MLLTSKKISTLRNLAKQTETMPGAPDGNAQYKDGRIIVPAPGVRAGGLRMNVGTARALLRAGLIAVQPTTRQDGLSTVIVTASGHAEIAAATLPADLSALLRLVAADAVVRMPDGTDPSVSAWCVESTREFVHYGIGVLEGFGFVEFPNRWVGTRPVLTEAGRAYLETKR